MDVTKPYRFTWLGAMDVNKPYELMLGTFPLRMRVVREPCIITNKLGGQVHVT